MLNNKSLLITGGTGSFGQKFVELILKKYPKIKRLVIFSRDELKQSEMSNRLLSKNKSLRFFLGDIRDKSRLFIALENIDYVIHAAALKQVPAAEYNPFEFIKTNVLGSNNLIEACIEKRVKKIIALSTDKAAAPVNLYGATKLCSDKLFIAANNIVGKQKTTFSIVRYGNVLNSRGSVLPIFLNKKKNEPFLITHSDMTRFNITLDYATKFVLYCLINSLGKEIFVPKLPSYKILDLACSIDRNAKIKITGIREGEKLFEEMITESDSLNTIQNKQFYVILPNNRFINKYLKKYSAKKIKKIFSYNSKNNMDCLSQNDIRNLLREKKFL